MGLVAGTNVDLLACEASLPATSKVQVQSDKFLEMLPPSCKVTVSFLLCTYPRGRAVGVRLPQEAAQKDVGTPSVSSEAEVLQPLSLQCLQVKLETRHTHIH